VNEELKARLRKVFLEESRGDSALIRDLLPKLEAELPRPATALIEEFYKAVHKLKGACRAVGLKAAETLGFQVEYLFRHLAEHPADLSQEGYDDVCAAIDTMVELIEGYARSEEGVLPWGLATRLNQHLKTAGSDQQAELPEAPQEAQASEVSEQPKAQPPPEKPKVDPRLLAAFSSEAKGLFQTLNEALAKLATLEAGEAQTAAVNAALHAAHTLKGSARVVQMPELTAHAHELESQFKDLLEAGKLPEEAQLAEMRKRVVEMELPLFADRSLSPKQNADAKTNEEAVSSPDIMYRVEAERLEELFSRFSDVLALQTSLSGLHARVRELSEQMLDLQKQERELRQRIGPILHQPSHARVAAYVNHMSRSLRSLAGGLAEQQTDQRGLEDQFSSRLRALEEQVSAVQVVPVEEVFAGLKAMVLQLAKDLGKSVQLDVEGLREMADRHLLQHLRAPLIHLLRNALDHGIEDPQIRIKQGKSAEGHIQVQFHVQGDRFFVRIQDDGAGVNLAALRRKVEECGLLSAEQAQAASDDELRHWIFSPHLSTSDQADTVSGRGMGLSSVEEFVRERDGSVLVQDAKPHGTCFLLEMPVQRATTRITLLRRGSELYAVPSRDILRGFRLEASSLESLKGSPGVRLEEGLIPLRDLGELLGLDSGLERPESSPALLIQSGDELLVLQVDSLEGEGAHVLRPLPSLLASRKRYANAVLDEHGRIVLVLDLLQLLGASAAGALPRNRPTAMRDGPPAAAHEPESSRILVVDDSYTSRTLEMGVLESYGYDVRGAVDGLDGLAKLRQEPVDLIVSDIEMPRMNGFEFLQELKSVEAWKHIPVIMISSLEDESIIRKGLSLGADSYIVKKRFEHDSLLETIQHYL